MVDFNKLAPNLLNQVKNALALNTSGDNNRVDSKQEYDTLAKLLSGQDKKSEAYQYIDDLMFDGLESNLISPAIRNAVREIVSRMDTTKADLKSEVTDLKDLKKQLKSQGELTPEAETYINRVINKHAIGIEQTNSLQISGEGQNPKDTTPAEADKMKPKTPPAPEKEEVPVNEETPKDTKPVENDKTKKTGRKNKTKNLPKRVVIDRPKNLFPDSLNEILKKVREFPHTL